MKKLLLAALALVLLAAAYIASPFLAAWSIREAIRTGNSEYLAAKLEWPTVRATLRASLTEYAIGQTPVATAGSGAAKPGIWQRIKNGFSRRAVDNIVESYVTPEGLPQLFGMRQYYRENVSGAAAADAARPWHERVASFWSRIKRAEFHSPTEFEIEMADRNDPTRHYIGLLKLRCVEWKLTELRLRTLDEAALPLAADPA
ncbi:DUF2939 domain-containing protein [Hyphomicrobium sp. LHD-15]|uniref:DUF2939 domain-containing protein n=1 Tax=Hyphomicrobium sp. LHD-15 TaxID=3072142 RepID=UPI00280FF91C|nr:DUF2939 domain-containing protein [Hyphomicrobium sp. LHD-15]MDQ8700043.1 DUF2939 domain-containing protein [Hyphomicrobium sp. LHD-15]